MTDIEIINGILDREKRGTPPYLSKNDAGGRTSWGISERVHPQAWKPGPPTRAEAFQIYRVWYVQPFDKLIAAGVQDALREVLIDDAVMSGGKTALKSFQKVLGVPADGVIGPKTITALRKWNQNALQQAYVIARLVRLTRLVQNRPSDLTNLTGWVTRVLSFLPEVV